jgi:2-polyprenyl-6-methoxyphenol hydroxylase-like FAD-dependent oxidoreductase
MLGFLLARRGIDVLVLEKHGDFLRDFRGDTIHPSTIQIMDEVGLADELLELPHAKASTLQIHMRSGTMTVADFRRLKTRWPYIMFLPQWDFLNFLTDYARRYPSFHLVMNAEGQSLIEEGGVIRGVRYKAPDGWHEVYAALTVAADGRSSQMRNEAGLVPIETSAPMDVLWFRLSRRESDPGSILFNIDAGHVIGLIYRDDFWQVAYVIPKGTDPSVREAGLSRLKESLCRVIPWLADRVDELQSWEQIKLLVVQSNRLRRWYRPGLLCIGDAAHAMSPVGGVGINLAIQDAVAAANILSKPLLTNEVQERHLEAVQRRRALPTRVIQTLQSLMQRGLAGPTLRSSRPPDIPVLARMLLRLPGVRTLPARLVGFGVWPAHVRNE